MTAPGRRERRPGDVREPGRGRLHARRSVTAAVEEVEEVERPDGAEKSHAELTLVRSATAPATPSSPSTRVNPALGLPVRLAAGVGVGVAVLRAVLDTGSPRQSLNVDSRRRSTARAAGGVPQRRPRRVPGSVTPSRTTSRRTPWQAARQGRPLDDVVHAWDDRGLAVLPSGPTPHNPCELLDSVRMRDVIDVLTGRYDAVIVDTPAPRTAGRPCGRAARRWLAGPGAGPRRRRPCRGEVDPGRGAGRFDRSVSRGRLPNRTCGSHRIRLSTRSCRWSGRCRLDPRCRDVAPVAVAGDRHRGRVEQDDVCVLWPPSLDGVAAPQCPPAGLAVLVAQPAVGTAHISSVVDTPASPRGASRRTRQRRSRLRATTPQSGQPIGHLGVKTVTVVTVSTRLTSSTRTWGSPSSPSQRGQGAVVVGASSHPVALDNVEVLESDQVAWSLLIIGDLDPYAQPITPPVPPPPDLR